MAPQSNADAVDPAARGLLLGLHLIGADESALGALADDQREACVLAWRGLCARDERERTRTFAAWRAEARRAAPAGVSGLHPSWGEEALAGERAEVVAAVRRGPAAEQTIPEEVARELARLAYGRLAPLCESPAGPLAERLCSLEFDELLTEITRAGALTLGHSLAGATPPLRASAMAAAGEPWAREIAEGAQASATREERETAAALVRKAAAAEGRTPSERLLAVGLARLKPELAGEGPGSLLRVAGRLPTTLGRALIGW